MKPLPERVHDALQAFPHWSRAELRILPTIESNVIEYLADGTGSLFTRMLCEGYVIPAVFEVQP